MTTPLRYLPLVLLLPSLFASPLPGAALTDAPQRHDAQAQAGLHRPEPTPTVPVNAMSRKEVIRLYGIPLEKRPPVGTPPISRWIYPHFTVYFEGQRVIHTVHDRLRPR